MKITHYYFFIVDYYFAKIITRIERGIPLQLFVFFEESKCTIFSDIFTINFFKSKKKNSTLIYINDVEDWNFLSFFLFYVVSFNYATELVPISFLFFGYLQPSMLSETYPYICHEPFLVAKIDRKYPTVYKDKQYKFLKFVNQVSRSIFIDTGLNINMILLQLVEI